jgi:hypothetical protein
VKIEILNDSASRGLHHVHFKFKVADPVATLEWYQKSVRQEADGKTDGLLYGSVWLLTESGVSTPGSQCGSGDPAGRLADSDPR